MMKPSKIHACKKQGLQRGFTLIELMVVMVIISILAAIAIPSYRQFARKNAEEQARSSMLTIENEISNWRSKTLSYKGFIPKNLCSGINGNCYSSAGGVGNTEIYVPLGTDASTHKYLITIGDAVGVSGGRTGSVESLTDNASIGVGWRMLAIPNPSNSNLFDAYSYVIDSFGNRCAYETGTTLPANNAAITCSGAGKTKW